MMVGRTLGNRYEIIEELGGGGMAIVYKGRDRSLNRLVTIKILRPEFTVDKEFIRRFQNEAQAVASLSHPNIVSIYDVGQEDNIHYLVMEYVRGENLKNVIQHKGPLSLERAVYITLQICEALEHAHENNIVHHDVKPHNILITREGWAKLTDFGIAREVTASTFTCTGTVVGSVHYLSPEQAKGQIAGPESDLYSLGVVLYEMLTCTVPFQGDNPVAVAIKHIQEEPEPPRALNSKISVKLEQVILKAMQKNPSNRFKNAREMSFYLKKAISNDNSADLVPGDSMDTKVLKPVKKTIEEKKTPFKVLGWVFLGPMFLVLMAGGIYALYEYFFNIPEIRVTNVVNKDLKEATDLLKGLGLRVAIIKEYHPEIPEGHVIAQDIGPEDPKVKPPQQITLTVSLGPDLRDVPDLCGSSLSEARLKLAGVGLKLANPVREGFSERIPKGYIYHQEPQPESKLAKGSFVTVYLSKGPPPRKCEIPDLTGLTIDQARAKLNERGLKMDENIEWVESNKYLSGQVVTQEPAPLIRVLEGATVKIVVSKGPGPLPKTLKVTVCVPDDKQEHKVRISVEDVKGERDVYINKHAPGDEIIEEVVLYERGTVRVYIDEAMVEEKTYE